MKPQEAIEELKYSIEPNQGFMECRTGTISEEAIKIAIEALGKQMPKKRIERIDSYSYCPKCDAALSANYYKARYCHNCGQRLDWEDRDD